MDSNDRIGMATAYDFQQPLLDESSLSGYISTGTP